MPAITKLVERWFPYPNDPLGGEVLIHHLTPGEENEITNKTFKQDVSYKQDGDKMIPSVKQNTDMDLNLKLTRDAAIKNWKNFFKEDGKTPLKFSEKNITLCVEKIEGFVAFIAKCRKKLSDDIAQEKKDQLKNLKGSVLKLTKPEKIADSAEPQKNI